MKPVLLFQTGETPERLRAKHGDPVAWLARALHQRGQRTEVALAHEGQLPSLKPYAGAVISGNFNPELTLDEWQGGGPTPWARALAEHVFEEEPVPILGICFGHQLLGHMRGGQVEANPKGLEAGAAKIHLTPEGRADPLFDGMAPSFRAPQLHTDHVSRLPDGAVHLAGNSHTEIQSYALGDNVRCVQFHPEMDRRTLRTLLNEQPPRTRLRRTRHRSRTVIDNWVDHFVRYESGEPFAPAVDASHQG